MLKLTEVSVEEQASNQPMAGRRIRRHHGKPFALIMLVILAFLIVMVLSVARHVSSVPNSGPLPNQQLQH